MKRTGTWLTCAGVIQISILIWYGVGPCLDTWQEVLFGAGMLSLLVGAVLLMAAFIRWIVVNRRLDAAEVSD
jgi:hypothetical protein